jgi:hypothetical protein
MCITGFAHLAGSDFMMRGAYLPDAVAIIGTQDLGKSLLPNPTSPRVADTYNILNYRPRDSIR